MINSRNIFFMVLALMVSTLIVSSCESRKVVGLEPITLFKMSPVDSVPYRIPALAQMKNGRLLALTDYRLCNLDIGFGRVDLHGRISSRNTERRRGKGRSPF